MIRKTLYILSSLIILLLITIVIWQVPKWQVNAYRTRFDNSTLAALTPKERIEFETNLISAENSARTTVAQSIGGLLLILSLGATWYNIKETLRVTEEGKITERFSKAIEMLGNDHIEIKLGGIYALERIAKDSQKDHWTIMEVLSSYVREKATELRSSEAPATYNYNADIRAILTVFSRRKWVATEGSRKLNLTSTNLGGARLSEAHLSGANFIGANLHGADLSNAFLNGADLMRANLSKANLKGADLSNAFLFGANLKGAHLNRANLNGAHLNRADLNGADLTDVRNLPETETELPKP
jgi:hypothetical protein